MSKKKKDAIRDFLLQLEDAKNTMAMMSDRMDMDALRSMEEYSHLIAEVQNQSLEISKQEIALSSMIIGYLLKSFMDRYSLTSSLED